MLNGWIELGLVSQAYGLDAEECIELAQHSSRKYGIFSNNQPYDIKYIDELAKSYARNLLKKSNKQSYFTAYYIAMKGWRNITLEQAKIDFEPLYTTLRKIITPNDLGFNVLWPITRLLFITDLCVNKRQAIQFLYKHGYSLQQEVKGITRSLVENITSNYATPPEEIQPQEGNCMTPALESPSKPLEKELKTRERNSYLKVIASLAQKNRPLELTSPRAASVIKAGIERCGLELSDQTIRKIIKEVREVMEEKE